MTGSGDLHKKNKDRNKPQSKALHEHLLQQTCSTELVLNWLIYSNNYI